MPSLHIYNIILPKYFVKVKEKGSSLNFSALGGWDKEKNRKSAEKIAGDFQRAGKKKRGSGGNEFLPARSVWGGKRFRNSALAEYQNRKIFVSLIENNFGGAQLKNVKKIFLFCSPKRSGGGRKRWAGLSPCERQSEVNVGILLKIGSDFVQKVLLRKEDRCIKRSFLFWRWGWDSNPRCHY